MGLLRSYLSGALDLVRDYYGRAFRVEDLDGRVARCPCCGDERPSSVDLPYFEFRPDDETDGYQCRGYLDLGEGR